MRRSTLVGVVLFAVAFALIGGPSVLFSPTTSETVPATASDREVEMVRPTGGESGFWPYLNARPAFGKRSPINVVVVGDTDTVVRLLVESGEGNWQETDEEQEEAGPGTHAIVVESGNESAGNATVENGTVGNATAGNGSAGNATVGNWNATTGSAGDGDGNASLAENENESARNESADGGGFAVGSTRIRWGQTTGATRYAYVDPGDGEDGRWVTETAQVHDGYYYGHRYHIRMYESPNPDEPWVAMQAHSEHFDWFTLRHHVEGSHRAQMRLEADLMALPGVDEREDVRRVYLGNRNSRDADGWATFVDLAGVVLVGLVLGLSMPTEPLDRTTGWLDDHLTETDRRRIEAVRQRLDARHLALATSILAIILGVRTGGVALERSGLLSMHAIAAVLYPFVGLGLPVATWLVAGGLERPLDAAVVASGSFAVAIWLEYGLMGVNSIPVDVVFQRMLVAVALGLIAGGSTRRTTRDSRWNGMLVVGVLLWVVVLGGTLFGHF